MLNDSKGYRKKSLCCTPNATAMKTLNCNADLCKGQEDACDDESGFLDVEDDGYFSLLSKRSYELHGGKVMWSYDRPQFEERAGARPGDPRTFVVRIGLILKSSLYKDLEAITRAYPTGQNVLRGDGAETIGLMGGFT